MSFTVIGAPLSPFVRKVHVVMALKNIEFTMDPVSPFDLPEGYEKINPAKRIPVLKHDDVYICDSSVICRYLEDLYPEPPLAAGSPLVKARIAWLERLADNELAPAISATAFRHRVVYRAMGKPFDEAEIDAIIKEQAPPLYDYLNESIGQNEFLVGEQISLADIAVISQFINASLGSEHVDEQRWPNLARYVAHQFDGDVFASRIASARKIVDKMLAGAK